MKSADKKQNTGEGGGAGGGGYGVEGRWVWEVKDYGGEAGVRGLKNPSGRIGLLAPQAEGCFAVLLNESASPAGRAWQRVVAEEAVRTRHSHVVQASFFHFSSLERSRPSSSVQSVLLRRASSLLICRKVGGARG